MTMLLRVVSLLQNTVELVYNAYKYIGYRIYRTYFFGPDAQKLKYYKTDKIGIILR